MASKIHNCCALCYFARNRRDGFCGVYCTGGFESKDGTCDLFICYDDRKSIKAFNDRESRPGRARPKAAEEKTIYGQCRPESEICQ